MISFTITVATRDCASADFTVPNFAEPVSDSQNGIRLELASEFPYRITVTPPAGDVIRSISYTASTNLRNFHEVIVPDTGRGYSSQTQLVNFWAKRFTSRMSNVRMPIYILKLTDFRDSDGK